MLFINYKGDTPQQRFYSIGVKGNHNANKIRFVVARKQADVDLSDFACTLKIENKEVEYKDLAMLDLVSESDSELTFEWVMTNKNTQFRNLELQLEFLGGDEENSVVWQTLIVGLELSDTIKVGDETPSDEELSVLKQVVKKVNDVDVRVDDLDEQVDELSHEVENAKEIIIDNPDDYLNDNGLKKIIRQQDDNGSVENSYIVNKKHTPSTLVVCQPTFEVDNEFLEDSDMIMEDLGEDSFRAVFGNDAYIDEYGGLFSVYYNQNSEITKGIRFGTLNDGYGNLGIHDCEPNKIIKIVVGKYFEYDEQGNKVFDEHSVLYCDYVVGEPYITCREITQEKQTFILKTNGDGEIYFDSDGADIGFGDTRFILYEISCGEEASDTFEKKKIAFDNDGKVWEKVVIEYNAEGDVSLIIFPRDILPLELRLPTGITSSMFFDFHSGNVVDVNGDVLENVSLFYEDVESIAILVHGYDLTNMDFYGEGGHFYYIHRDCCDDWNSIYNNTLYMMFPEKITKTLTQEQYDELETKDPNMLYFIYEE